MKAKLYWTYAGDGQGAYTFHGHSTEDAAHAHYSMMRNYGGPKTIGMRRKPATADQLERDIASASDRIKTYRIL